MKMSSPALARLGVLGGTFDPIHTGHLVAASEVLHALDLDRVLFVPAGRPWQKAFYSDPEDRYLMTVLGTASHSRLATSRMEIDRVGATYTVDTLSRLHTFHGPGTEIYFIVGTDALVNLGTWRAVDQLKDLCDIVVVNRPGIDHPTAVPDSNWPRIHVLETPGVEVSSTDIRERVRDGRPIDYLVPPDVADYIRTHGLYVGESEARGA
jgi:nicotinate-nucleotide adenylyltransferase